MARAFPDGRRPAVSGLRILCLAGLIGLAACSRSNPSAPAPPPPVVIDPFDMAESAYDRGLFVAAANAYNLAIAPDSPTSMADQERAHAQLALIHAMPESPFHNLEAAEAHLVELRERFPASREGALARTLIALQAQIVELERMVDQMDSTMVALRSTIDAQETARSEQSTAIHALESEVEQLQTTLAATRTELETLREIDRQLRERN
jgi:flagellar biosynthesis chaperone FliJ